MYIHILKLSLAMIKLMNQRLLNFAGLYVFHVKHRRTQGEYGEER